jgi:hypothetical protein
LPEPPRIIQPPRKRESKHCFFEKKQQKTLLLRWVMGGGQAKAPDPAKRSLFASFSSEKEALTS